MSTSQQIDDYFAKAADFAQPILEHFRSLVHEVCPMVEEKMKWSMPHFDYKGEMMCSIAAFKHHCAIGFWKASLMQHSDVFKEGNAVAMGHMGKIKSMTDLPSDDQLVAYLNEAMLLNDLGIKMPPKAIVIEKKALVIASDFEQALLQNATAQYNFERFTYGRRKEYIAWFDEAKTIATRLKRINTAIEWIAEGKSRDWKYER